MDKTALLRKLDIEESDSLDSINKPFGFVGGDCDGGLDHVGRFMGGMLVMSFICVWFIERCLFTIAIIFNTW